MSTPAGAAALVSGAFQRYADGTLIFPPFPGLSFDYSMRLTWSTIYQEAADGSAVAIQIDPYPRWEYDLSLGHLSDDPSQGCLPRGIRNPLGMTALYQFLGLYCAVGGRRDPFMLRMADFTRRESDSHVRGLQIGTGDGVTTSFQLVRAVGGFLDLIENPVNLVLEVAGAVVTPSSVVNGLVTLATAPATGASVLATFDWLHRMRFTKDSEDATAVWYQMYTKSAVKLVSERNVTS